MAALNQQDFVVKIEGFMPSNREDTEGEFVHLPNLSNAVIAWEARSFDNQTDEDFDIGSPSDDDEEEELEEDASEEDGSEYEDDEDLPEHGSLKLNVALTTAAVTEYIRYQTKLSVLLRVNITYMDADGNPAFHHWFFCDSASLFQENGSKENLGPLTAELFCVYVDNEFFCQQTAENEAIH